MSNQEALTDEQAFLELMKRFGITPLRYTYTDSLSRVVYVYYDILPDTSIRYVDFEFTVEGKFHSVDSG